MAMRATSRDEEVAHRGQQRGVPGPRWRASMRLAMCRTAVTSAWSLCAVASSGLRPSRVSLIGCDPHQPSRWLRVLLAVALGRAARSVLHVDLSRRGGWRLIATGDESKLRASADAVDASMTPESSATVSRGHQLRTFRRRWHRHDMTAIKTVADTAALRPRSRRNQSCSIVFARRCGFVTTAAGPRKPTSRGSGGSSSSTARRHPSEMGGAEIAAVSDRSWRSSGRSARRRRTRRSARCCSCTARCLRVDPGAVDHVPLHAARCTAAGGAQHRRSARRPRRS